MNASLARQITGSFASKISGQFAPVLGGQFTRFLHLYRGIGDKILNCFTYVVPIKNLAYILNCNTTTYIIM